ncbi:MAG: hypothetical protein KKB62_00215, partial [Nanoarchaeota archaeon]|nr:hypothetical protein [Nanoarchaeota archaeon]
TTFGTNYSNENLTCYNQSTTGYGTLVNNFDFRMNGSSITALNMPFNLNVPSTATGAIVDYSTYENNGTLGNGTANTAPTWTPDGKIGGTYNFDGQNDLIVIPYNESLGGNGTWSEFSMEAWFIVNSSDSSGTLISNRKGTSTTDHSYTMGLSSGSLGYLYCFIGGTTTVGTAPNNNASDGCEPLGGPCPKINVGSWQHYVCTYKDGEGIKMYLNGTLIGTQTSASGNLRVSEGVVRIGARGTGVNPPNYVQPWNGTIDEVKIYSNRALSAEEILDNYNEGYNRLVSQELENYTNYTCSVALTNNINTNISLSNQITILPYSAPSIFDDVQFDSSFESGNLYNVTYVSGDANGNRNYRANIAYTNATDACSATSKFTDFAHWWTFFEMTNTSGKNITINLTGLASDDFVRLRWDNARPRYSFDYGLGNVDNSSNNYSMGTWTAIMPPDSYQVNTNGLWVAFNITVPSGQNTTWVATADPYTVRRRDLYLADISSSPYVNISVINTTTFGLNLTSVTVTDSAYSDANKVKIYIIGQQHANEEVQGSWYSEGAINYLINESNATAAQLRRNYIFRFVPIVNVDGVYNGTGRYSPYYNGTTIYDPNRCWDDARTGQPLYNVVNWTFWDIVAFDPNASIDVHGSITNSSTIFTGYNYYLDDGLQDTAMINFMKNISVYWENEQNEAGGLTGGTETHPYNVRLSTVAVHPAMMMENTVTNFSGTTDVPDYNDWMRYGVEMLLGIRDYYNNTLNGAAAPTIPYVEVITAKNPTEDSITTITFNFTVTDGDGSSNINTSSGKAYFQRGGETTRSDVSCVNQTPVGNSINFSCSIDMWYYDGAGAWTINVSAQDNEGEYVENSSTTFTYNLLTAMKMSPTSMGWPELSLASTDVGSSNNPIIINNTGNAVSLGVNTTAYDLQGEQTTSEYIYANNFTIGISSEGCSGTAMSNATAIAISSAVLNKGNHSLNDGSTGQEQIYFCIKGVPPTISSQSYSSSVFGPWGIGIFLALLVSGGRRKKKRNKTKLEEDKLFDAFELIAEELREEYSLNKKELLEIIIKKLKKKYNFSSKELLELISKESFEIPVSIFRKEIGSLESIVKYMKENLNMKYVEIAKALGRDERTIWTSYKKSKEKFPEAFAVKEDEETIPASIFKENDLTVLESIVVYLKKKGLKYSEIAQIIGRDQRNVWTIYLRASKKLNKI